MMILHQLLIVFLAEKKQALHLLFEYALCQHLVQHIFSQCRLACVLNIAK